MVLLTRTALYNRRTTRGFHNIIHVCLKSDVFAGCQALAFRRQWAVSCYFAVLFRVVVVVVDVHASRHSYRLFIAALHRIAIFRSAVRPFAESELRIVQQVT